MYEWVDLLISWQLVSVIAQGEDEFISPDRQSQRPDLVVGRIHIVWHIHIPPIAREGVVGSQIPQIECVSISSVSLTKSMYTLMSGGPIGYWFD